MDMDHVDARQEAAIEQLHGAAKENRQTDALQWLAIAVFALGLSVYVGMILGAALSSQGRVIQALSERCGK